MNESNELIPLLLALIAGGIIGFLIYHLTLGRSNSSKQQEELEKNKIELEKYKAQVNDHFNSSAELMGQVASSYQALYSHMADQSQSLLGETAATQFPLLKEAENTNQEIEITEGEVNSDEVEVTETELKPEDVEVTETEVKSDDVEITETEVKSDDVEITENEVKSEDIEITETEMKSENSDVKKEETK